MLIVNLFNNVLKLNLKWAVVFLIVLAIFAQLCKLSIQAINCQLALLDFKVLSFDILLLTQNFEFFFLKFSDQVCELLFKQIVLRLSVQVVDLNSGDFVGYAFDLNFLPTNLLESHFGLLQKVGTALLDSFLLTGVVYYIVADVFGLCVQLHNRLLKDLHFFFHVSSFLVHADAFGFSLAQ